MVVCMMVYIATISCVSTGGGQLNNHNTLNHCHGFVWNHYQRCKSAFHARGHRAVTIAS